MKKKNKTFNPITTYLAFSLAFYTLLFLGMWQLNKHKIKTYNKSLITSEANQQPKELSSLKEDISNFQTITIRGNLLEDKTLFFEPRTHKGKVGYHLIVPLQLGSEYVLVNRGFTLNKKKKNTDNILENVNGLIINFPKSKFFELENDIENNRWFSLNLEEISGFLNINLEPYLIYESNGSSNDLINVKPNTISDINHLNYSITWFMLAITLAIILIIFVRKAPNEQKI